MYPPHHYYCTVYDACSMTDRDCLRLPATAAMRMTALILMRVNKPQKSFNHNHKTYIVNHKSYVLVLVHVTRYALHVTYRYPRYKAQGTRFDTWISRLSYENELGKVVRVGRHMVRTSHHRIIRIIA